MMKTLIVLQRRFERRLAYRKGISMGGCDEKMKEVQGADTLEPNLVPVEVTIKVNRTAVDTVASV